MNLRSHNIRARFPRLATLLGEAVISIPVTADFYDDELVASIEHAVTRSSAATRAATAFTTAEARDAVIRMRQMYDLDPPVEHVHDAAFENAVPCDCFGCSCGEESR